MEQNKYGTTGVSFGHDDLELVRAVAAHEITSISMIIKLALRDYVSRAYKPQKIEEILSVYCSKKSAGI